MAHTVKLFAQSVVFHFSQIFRFSEIRVLTKKAIMIAIGIAGIFLFHMVENIGMTMGLLPITGVPLPFVSYGGSSMITNFMCIAMLLNISGRRQKTIFMN